MAAFRLVTTDVFLRSRQVVIERSQIYAIVVPFVELSQECAWATAL
jgi:hypothetical protein